MSVPAYKFTSFLVKNTEAFHKVFQYEEENRELFIDVLVALYRQYSVRGFRFLFFLFFFFESIKILSELFSPSRIEIRR